MLRRIAQGETIEIPSSAANEGFHLSKASKTMISDLPAWLRDNRLADLEMQKHYTASLLAYSSWPKTTGKTLFRWKKMITVS